jgi:hypothetical protein
MGGLNNQGLLTVWIDHGVLESTTEAPPPEARE